MTLDLADYEARAHEAVKLFWGNRNAAIEKQIASGRHTVTGHLARMRRAHSSDG